jgi:site-specific recombinase XerD
MPGGKPEQIYEGGFFVSKIMEASERVLKFLWEIPLSSSTIKHYKSHLRGSIVPYCKLNCIENFSDDEMQDYAKEQMSKVENGEFSRSTMVHRRKAAALLADCMQGRELVWEHRSFKRRILCEYFEEVSNNYYTHISQSLASRTAKRHVGIIRQFLCFIEHNSSQDLNEITPENVKDFIANAAPNNKSSLSTLMGAIRKFLSYLADAGLASVNAEWGLVNPPPRHRKLLPCFTDKEMEAILNSVDKTTPIGKRDYAIMMISLWTGLRGIDILNLKRSDIDWNCKVINVVQNKTLVGIKTELLPGVGNAIADYILNGRPKTDSPYIFVRHKRPYDRLSSVGRDIMTRCLRKAGIHHEAWDGKSFHAFRRTFGTRLVRAGVPIKLVSELLGHTDPNSARNYVALDIEGLRVCCLEISMFRTKKVGLI